MSRYIDLDLYHAVEKTHPFYVEMLAEIKNVLESHQEEAGTLRVVEFGAGTGLSTSELLAVDSIQLDAVEIDPECHELLMSHIGDRATCICADAVNFGGKGEYDAAVSIFAHDHIPPDKARLFGENIRRNLKSSAIYVMGGELLPAYQTEEEMRRALLVYHGYIVQEALRCGHYEVAKLEIDALKSGMDKVGDFKRHEEMFEAEMSEAGLNLKSKKKIGPEDLDNVGGVFVYVFEAI